MKHPILALALMFAVPAAGTAREAHPGDPPAARSDIPVLTGRINDLQATIVESMRATEAADRDRRMARLSFDINALQGALVQALRDRASLDR